jgi:RNA polymerase sigma-70 factor, ECF subfamily
VTTTTQLKSVDDLDLVLRTATGDVEAFEALYRRHRADVYRAALRVTRRSRAAEEVTQDTFLGLWRTANRYDPNRGTLKTWLQIAARNRSIDWLRRESRHERDLKIGDEAFEPLVASDCTEDDVANEENSRETRELLAILPAEQRQVIELAYFGQLTHTEIAKRVGIPLGTVKGRQRLALTKLHRRLQPAV